MDPLDRATSLYLEGNYQEALGEYLSALVQSPDDPRVHCGLGEVLEALGRPGEALLAFEQALRLDPGHAWAHFGRGGVLQGLGRYGEATAAYRRAGELAPGEVAFHRALGIVLYLRDDLEGSVAAYRQALKADPEDALSHYGLGLDLDALGWSEQAITAYERAVACDPEDAWSHLRLAGLLARGRRAGATEHLRQAKALLGEGDVWGQAILAVLRGHMEQGLSRVREAVERLPESTDWLARDPDLEPLQADERFWLILRAGRHGRRKP